MPRRQSVVDKNRVRVSNSPPNRCPVEPALEEAFWYETSRQPIAPFDSMHSGTLIERWKPKREWTHNFASDVCSAPQPARSPTPLVSRKPTADLHSGLHAAAAEGESQLSAGSVQNGTGNARNACRSHGLRLPTGVLALVAPAIGQ
jgi:hypothetical protein